MTPFLAFLLVAHIILGVVGIFFVYALLMAILKPGFSIPRAKFFALSSLILFLLSWFSGGYYYYVYYGSKVKPVITAAGAPYPWAHYIFMEAKEHIFLFLPFLLIAVVAALFAVYERTREDSFRGALICITSVALFIGVFSLLSGIVISGGAR